MGRRRGWLLNLGGWFDMGRRKTTDRPLRQAQDRLTTNEGRVLGAIDRTGDAALQGRQGSADPVQQLCCGERGHLAVERKRL